MNREPEISIVIPAFNCERWLDRCLESLSLQTLKTREIIVVDDGSTDGTNAIAGCWSGKDPSISVIRKQNGGCASARSAGLHASRGRFVAFVDADDWVDREMYEKLLNLANYYDAEVVQAGFYKVHLPSEKKEKYDDRLGDGVRFFSTISDRVRYLLLMAQPSIWRRIYRRDFLERNHIDFPVDIRNYDDLTFHFETMMVVDRLVTTSEALYFYLLGYPEQSMSIRDERLFVHFGLFNYLQKCRDVRNDRLIWKCFKRVQFNSHIWSRSLLKREYRMRHEHLAAHDIFEVGGKWRSTQILLQLLAYTPERGLETIWALKCWLIYMKDKIGVRWR